MSLETDNQGPSCYLNGEGFHEPLSNSCAAAQPLGEGSEDDRTGRALRASLESFGGERRRGTWVNARGHGEGPADGRTEAETLFDRITTPPKVQKLRLRQTTHARAFHD